MSDQVRVGGTSDQERADGVSEPGGVSAPERPAARVAPAGFVHRAAHAVLAAAVRGRRDRGGPWGEAVLAELPMTRGSWETVRWAAGGLRTALRERHTLAAAVPRRLRLVGRVVAAALLGVAVSVAVDRWVLSVGYEPSGSMEPTLQIGDRYLVDRVAFRLTGIERGDIVEYHLREEPGTDPGLTFVKRVIGLPGDTIECRDGAMYRNGQALDEPYLPAGSIEAQAGECQRTTVPEGHLYVLGDHRVVSQDSRWAGPIGQDAVTGRLLVRVWPVRG